jgi:hypothetical protein
MANPNPQHTPTDGLGVAAYVTLSGGTGASAISSPSGGTPVHPGAVASPINGQGIGATAGGVFPVAQYAITLSLSAASTYETVAVLTAAAVDVKNNAYSPVSNFTAESYNDPAAGSPAWYRPSNFAGYSPNVASVVASGTNDATITVTALAVGQAVIEVAFPTFDNTLGTDPQAELEPDNFIYVQVIVTVIP